MSRKHCWGLSARQTQSYLQQVWVTAPFKADYTNTSFLMQPQRGGGLLPVRDGKWWAIINWAGPVELKTSGWPQLHIIWIATPGFFGSSLHEKSLWPGASLAVPMWFPLNCCQLPLSRKLQPLSFPPQPRRRCAGLHAGSAMFTEEKWVMFCLKARSRWWHSASAEL